VTAASAAAGAGAGACADDCAGVPVVPLRRFSFSMFKRCCDTDVVAAVGLGEPDTGALTAAASVPVAGEIEAAA